MIMGLPVGVGSDSDRQPAREPVRVKSSADKHLCMFVPVECLFTHMCTSGCICVCIEKIHAYIGA